MKLHIGITTRGTDFSLPLDYVTQSAAILAKRGAGKTYTTDVIVEELLECGQIPIIIDPTGAHWGLKSSADGKKPGYPVYVFGGDHADLPLEESSGEIIARALVENPFPSVIDTSLLRKGATNRFLGQFFETLYRLNRVPLHLICDECDLYAPQRPFGDEARTLGAMEDIVRRGRIKGIGCTLVSQRPQVVNKNVLTQCEMLFTMRLAHPKDIEALKEWVAVHGDEKTAKQMISDLPALPIGTAWVWCPGWGDIFERVKIRERRTFDSSATPKPGQAVVRPKEFAAVDVQKLGAQITATVERVKADDPKLLRSKIAQLERQIKETKPMAVTSVTDKTPTLRKLLQDAMKIIAKINAENFKIEGLKAEDIQQALNAAVIQLGKQAENKLNTSMNALARLQEDARILAEKIKSQIDGDFEVQVTVAHQPSFRVEPRQPLASRPPSSTSDPNLSGAERKVLAVLAQFGACEKGKLALLSGYTYSGGFRNTLSSLRSNFLIEGGNEAMMTITAAGEEVLGQYDVLPSGSALAEYWMSSGKLSPSEASVLRILLDHDGMTAEDLASAAGYTYSGGFRNILSTLRTAGVITGKNTDVLRAAENLQD